MVNKIRLEQLSALLQQSGLSQEERQINQELLEKAAQGDVAALRRLEQATRERTSFTPIPGDDPALPPGPLFVCPVDPAHYRAYRRDVGEDLICPEHGVPLEQINPEE